MRSFRLTQHHIDPPTERQLRRVEPGASPGTLIADPDADPTAIDLIWYDSGRIEERTLASLAELDAAPPQPGAVAWLDVRGLRHHDLIQEVGRRFSIHPLALADVVNAPQRPKTELYDHHLLVVAHMALLVPKRSGERALPDTAFDGHDLHMEQVSVVLGRGWVVTFQESASDGDALEPVRARLRQGRGKIRTCGADYLAYALLDAVVDGYYPVLDALGRAFEELEDLTLAKPVHGTGQRIHASKRVLLVLRRGIWHLRDAMASLLRDQDATSGDGALLAPTTLPYLRDVYDHVVQVVDMIETYREFAASLMDVYLSSVNNRMNEVVKVLTIISTIFLPLSFVAGIYGMNFHTDRSGWNMPELDWTYGYPFALTLMAVIAAAMLAAFRRFGWIGRTPRLPRDG